MTTSSPVLPARPRAFTSDWVSAHHDRWVDVLGHLRPRQAATIAELGSYEGRSALWFLDNVLWGPESTMWCFDPWQGEHDVERRFDENTAEARDARRLKKVKGDRWNLAQLPPAHFDAIYVDGDHQAHAVLADAVVAWRALAVGGIMIFDDYGAGLDGDMWNQVSMGVDSFLRGAHYRARVLSRTYQAIVQKVIND